MKRIVISVLVTLAATAVFGASTTYTSTAQFQGGALFNLNTDTANQLQLNETASTFPVMWIANAGEDTVSKIDTDTGRELARYRTWFGPGGQAGYLYHLGNAYAGAAPSRTAVDSDGNVYVANRHFDGKVPSYLKILASGGIDRNGNGTIDTSSDLNADGVIAGAEILPMGDANGNGRIDPAEIGDERIAWVGYLPNGTQNQLGRSLAIDGAGYLWAGTYSARTYYKLDPADGSVIAGPYNTSPATNYGALVDRNGILWGATLSSYLVRLDTATGAATVLNTGNGQYGIAIGNDKIYLGGGPGALEYNPATGLYRRFSGYSTSGIAVDADGNIFTGAAQMNKFAPDGTLLWSSAAAPGTGYGVGVQVDSNGDVWQIDMSAHKVHKRRGSDGVYLGSFPVGNSPYTYTDATGISRFTTTTPSGKWSLVQDMGVTDYVWTGISWNSEAEGMVPDGGSITAEIRVAATVAGLEFATFTPVSNGVAFDVRGAASEVRLTLTANVDGESPVLSDVTVSGKPPDDVPPATTATVDVAANGAGWNSGPVNVTLTAVDNDGGSGVDSLTWSASGATTGGETVSGDSATIAVTAEGETTITFYATDAAGNVEAVQTLVIRIDTIAPAVTCTADPAVLWPPDHKMRVVTATVSLLEGGSGAAGFTLLSVTSNEPPPANGDGNHDPDISGWDLGTADVSGELRAERSGRGVDRIYTISYSGADVAGNSASCSAQVVVPHDQKK